MASTSMPNSASLPDLLTTNAVQWSPPIWVAPPAEFTSSSPRCDVASNSDISSVLTAPAAIARAFAEDGASRHLSRRARQVSSRHGVGRRCAGAEETFGSPFALGAQRREYVRRPPHVDANETATAEPRTSRSRFLRASETQMPQPRPG